MPNYANGKIYEIWNGKLRYIGSTTQELKVRMWAHQKPSNTRSSRQVIDGGGAEIRLLEEYPCATRRELLMREREWMLKSECVNSYLPIRLEQDTKDYSKKYKQSAKGKASQANWFANNKDKLRAYRLNYDEENKERLNKLRNIARNIRREWSRSCDQLNHISIYDA